MNHRENRTSKKIQGFTLLELMISIAIVGIIAAIAIPSYLSYVKKARFSEIVKATAPYKLAVNECIQKLNTATGCSAGTNGIPAALGAVGHIASITVTDGVITATADATGGLSGETYILIPDNSVAGSISWTSSGTGVTNGLTGS